MHILIIFIHGDSKISVARCIFKERDAEQVNTIDDHSPIYNTMYQKIEKVIITIKENLKKNDEVKKILIFRPYTLMKMHFLQCY